MFRKSVLAIVVTLGWLCTASAGCYWSEPSPSENLSPVINGFTVEGEKIELLQVRENQETTVAVVAWDPNGDVLQEEGVSWETTDGTLLTSNPLGPYGPTIRFQAPVVDWQTVEPPLIVTLTVTVTDGVTEPVSKSIDVEILPPCPANDAHLEPVIDDITLSAEMIDLGDRVTITITAHDPEGEDLTFEWFPPFGDIDGTGNSVDWVTTDVCCTAWYDIEFIVSDGCKETWGFVSIYVNV